MSVLIGLEGQKILGLPLGSGTSRAQCLRRKNGDADVSRMETLPRYHDFEGGNVPGIFLGIAAILGVMLERKKGQMDVSMTRNQITVFLVVRKICFRIPFVGRICDQEQHLGK